MSHVAITMFRFSYWHTGVMSLFNIVLEVIVKYGISSKWKIILFIDFVVDFVFCFNRKRKNKMIWNVCLFLQTEFEAMTVYFLLKILVHSNCDLEWSKKYTVRKLWMPIKDSGHSISPKGIAIKIVLKSSFNSLSIHKNNLHETIWSMIRVDFSLVAHGCAFYAPNHFENANHALQIWQTLHCGTKKHCYGKKHTILFDGSLT